MAFDPIFGSFATRPIPQALQYPTGAFIHMLRDNFSITTWLLFGALVQGSACLLLPYPNLALVAPVFAFLFFKVLNILLIAIGILPDSVAKGVVPGRSVPIFPKPSSKIQDDPAGQPITAIMLAARSNSSLGIFAPGFKKVGDYFDGFLEEMNTDPTRYGYFGSTSWLSSNGDQATGSETMGFIYFENEQKLHEFAHGKSHTEAVEWYYRNGGKDFKHIGLMHEYFMAPKRGWDAVYLNYKPTGLGATTKEVQFDGKRVWINPLVKGKGKLSYSKGRMGRAYGSDEWEAYEEILGDEEKREQIAGKI